MSAHDDTVLANDASASAEKDEASTDDRTESSGKLAEAAPMKTPTDISFESSACTKVEDNTTATSTIESKPSIPPQIKMSTDII
jgi:hypothetical protein